MDQLTNMMISQQAVTIKRASKYCLYSRKSTEDDERQALSIESQVKEMTAMAERENLPIVEIRRESHSAKNSGERPIFRQMISDLNSGMFDGIITWAPDRLSRNAGDLGSLVDLMDQNKLIEIRTHGQKFTNSPSEKFLLMILCSQAKLENDNRGVNVKRGQRARLSTGYRPCMAPLGYLNERLAVRGQSKVFVDPERGHFVKQMFELVANKAYTGRDIYDWAQEVGLKTRTNKTVTLSAIYRMMSNTYYYGEFEYPIGSGNWYKGNYEPLITKELFQKARSNLLTGHRSKPGTKEFNFTKLLTCGSCHSGITAEEKIKQHKDGLVTRYVYYHCTRFQDQNCPEPFIREEELLEQLLNLIDNLDLDKTGLQQQVEQELNKLKSFSQGILGKTMDEKILASSFDAKSYAKYVLGNGSREEKQKLLKSLESKLYLKDRKLKIGK
jgi:DNA invertase Pin-like site-specific DNA recombinase